MTIKDKEARIKLFLQLIDSFKAESWVDSMYTIIEQHDLPKHLDRDFVLSALEQFYVKKEEYEKCANLVKWKEDILRLDLLLKEEQVGVDGKPKRKRKRKSDEDEAEYKDGFKVPDTIRQRFRKKK